MKRPYVCATCGETAMSQELGRLPTYCRVCRAAKKQAHYRKVRYPNYKTNSPDKYRARIERWNARRRETRKSVL